MGIGLGLVGLGSFGSEFAELFMSHPQVERIALCDLEPDRIREFATRPSWQSKLDQKDVYSSLDEICRSDLDALVIITQPWLHAAQCIQAMESGKHVYSAVPVVCLPDGDEILDWCDRLVSVCRRTGMHYMLGETTYYRPQTMFCRGRAREGAFGDFVYAEGEYFHDVDSACNLREVMSSRLAGRAGRQWEKRSKVYEERGVRTGPMHYPTHSTSGPISVMNTHAARVCAWGYANQTGDPYFDANAFSNEVALFQMANGATLRICECREIGHPGREMFRVYGTRGSFENDHWLDNNSSLELAVEEMRDPLPEGVVQAFKEATGKMNFHGGHGGSHAYLAHEFVDAIAHDRRPAINVWEAVRYMAAGVMAHKSALRDGEILEVPDWGDAPE